VQALPLIRLISLQIRAAGWWPWEGKGHCGRSSQGDLSLKKLHSLPETRDEFEG